MYFKAAENYLLAQFFDAEGAAFFIHFVSFVCVLFITFFVLYFLNRSETLWTNKMHWKAMIKGTNTMFFVLTWEKTKGLCS